MNRHCRTTGSRRLDLFIALTCVILGSACVSFAESQPSIALDSIQRIDVPDDRPEAWPFRYERWVPLNRDDFEKLLEKRTPPPVGPTTATWHQVRYTAVFAGDSLGQGRFQTQWRTTDATQRIASLGTPNFALEELSWSDGPAVWGTDLAARNWLWLDRKQGTLEGRWSRRGRLLRSGVAFDLEFLPATVTQLEIEVPQGLNVVSETSTVEILPLSDDQAARVWRIVIGPEARCRLVIAPTSPAESGVPTVLYEQETSFSFGSDDLLIFPVFQAEVLGGAIDRLTITTPRAVDILAGTYGDQTALKVERMAVEGPATHWSIQLPEPVRGRLKPIRLDGTMRRGTGDSLTIPQIGLEGGVWLDGRVNVTVSRPWELRSYRATGYRQLAPPATRVDGESISFQQLSTRPQLLLSIERPTTERVAHALNLLSTSEDMWTLTSEIAFGSRSGTVFHASCRIPDSWHVTSVVQLGGGRETEELPGWEVQTHPESGQLLLMEFSEGLLPGQINALRIVAQRSRSTGDAPFGWPVILPLDCESSEVLVTGRLADLKSVVPQVGEVLEPFDAASAAAVWNTLPSWSRVSAAAEPTIQLLQVTNLDSVRTTANRDPHRTLQADAEIQVNIVGEEVSEQIDIQLRGVSAQREQELQFSSSLSGMIWSLVEFPQEALVPRRVTQPSGAAAGELETYLFILPESTPDTVTLVGRRTAAIQSGIPVPLVFVPTARQFLGRVTVTVDRADVYRLIEATALGHASPSILAREPEALNEEPKRWTYRTPERNWEILTENRQSQSLEQAVYVLRSLVSGEPGGFDYHELSLSVPAGIDLGQVPVGLSQPAEWIAVLQNGHLMPTIREGDRWLLTGWNQSAGGKLQILYRTPLDARLLRTSHQLVVPELPWRCASFSWQASLPPHGDVFSLPGDFTQTRLTAGESWRERLFGPLSHPAVSSRVALLAHQDANSSPVIIPVGAAAAVVMTEFHFPTTWPTISASSFAVPVEVTFSVWDGAAVRLLTWTILLAGLPLGWWLRRSVGGRRTSWLAGLLAAAGSMAVFGPDVWNLVAGGGCAGLLMGCLLPIDRWYTDRRPIPVLPDPSGSTEVFRRAITPIGIGLLLGHSLTVALAQDTASTPAATAPRLENEGRPWRVLIPVGRDGEPSRKVPVVYVTPELYDSLSPTDSEKSSEPMQWISAADCMIFSADNRRLGMKVRYQLAVISASPPTELQIPLDRGWQAGLESCTLDGRLQPATATRDGRWLKVPVDQLPRADAPVNATRLQPWRYEVLLEIRLNPTAGDFRTDLFPILARRLTWQAAEPLQHVDLPESNGQILVSLDRRSVEASLGAVSSISLKNRATDQRLGSRGTTEMQILQLLTLRPAVTQVAFRVECRVLDGVVNRLEVTVPPGGVLREIRGHKVLQTHLLESTPSGTKIVLEFSEPLNHDFVVEGEYLVPRKSPDQRIEFTRLDAVCGESSTTTRHLVATASSPEFQSQLINLDDPTVLPIPVEQFVTRWGDSIPTLRPHTAFQVQDAGQPAFRLTALPAEQHVLSWQEDITISRRRLDWVLSAELTAPRLPLLTYTLLLDRRLNLESVSVRENGAEQLLRWSKTPMIGSSQNRVTLFLNRETAGTSQLRIRGSLRVRPSTPVALPSVRFETAQSVMGTLTISHEAGHRLLIEGRETPLVTEPVATENPAGEPTPQPIKRWKIPEGDSGLTLRLDPLAGACTQQSWWRVSPDALAFHVRGRVVLQPQEGTREIRLPLPEWLANGRLSFVPSGSPPFQVTEDGQRFLQWSCGADVAARLELTWDVELPLPSADTLRLPLPTALKSVDPQAWVSIDPERDWILTDHPDLVEAVLADELRRELSVEGQESDAPWFSWDGGVLTVQRRDGQSPDGRSSVWLLEHALQITAEGGWQGQADIYPSPAGDVIDLVLPAGTKLLTLMTDGIPISLDEYDPVAQRWRVLNAGQYRRLSVRWERAAEPRAFTGIGEITALLPMCVQERQPETFVRLSGATTEWYTQARNSSPLPVWELSCARIEAGLKRFRQLQESQTVEESLARSLWSEYHRTAVWLASGPTSQAVSKSDRTRWATLSEAMSQVPEPRGEPRDTSVGVTGEPELSPQDQVYRLPPDKAEEFACWILSANLGRWLAGSLMFFAVAGLLWPLLGWLSLPWWRTRKSAAWLLCGVVWWFCFSPQILGVAMIAWAGWEWLQQSRTVAKLASQ